VQNFYNQIHEIMLAHRMVEARAELQVREFRQQQDTSQEIITFVTLLQGIRYTRLTDRVQSVMDKQKMLLARSDRILQALVDKASPELSEHEKKWFEELRRMKDEVAGAGRYDEGSFAARARLVSSHLGSACDVFY
jgi:nucleoporin NUP82